MAIFHTLKSPDGFDLFLLQEIVENTTEYSAVVESFLLALTPVAKDLETIVVVGTAFDVAEMG